MVELIRVAEMFFERRVSTWSFMRAIKGETTMVVPPLEIAGN